MSVLGHSGRRARQSLRARTRRGRAGRVEATLPVETDEEADGTRAAPLLVHGHAG